MSDLFEVCFYFSDEKKYEKKASHQFIVETARSLDLPGCTLLRSVESFGKNKKMHAENFFELQGNCEYIAIFVLNEAQKQSLYSKLKEAQFSCYITKASVETDVIS
ncbi:hypothetical protein COB11_08280 [Candidatus Aerophobetes bacterium]|uniref:Uncharacterized protein n=1 Tax=Aerophobetes bacterium TaxID=2030807 RepID=A0A2A4YAE1_UNCAE|nr:MAG: hypothetical protein COB11_08280 [Candidatus Aerophobetes bacterium]